jgi:hypothetical protein
MLKREKLLEAGVIAKNQGSLYTSRFGHVLKGRGFSRALSKQGLVQSFPNN